MAAYASVDDLEVRWRPMSPEERARAQARLEDAAERIDAACAQRGKAASPQAARLVSIDMVLRALARSGTEGWQSYQQGAGPYQGTVTFAQPEDAPGASLYLTRDNRRMLGLLGQVIGTVRPWARAPEGGGADGW